MKKISFTILGLISVGLGVIGIFVPVMPTTPFLLLAAALFFRSNDRLYNWLLEHKILGKFIKDYRTKKALPLKLKIYSISIIWISISISSYFVYPNLLLLVILVACALFGTFFISRIPTLK